MLKEHAVRRLQDARGSFALSYALKRLSKTEDTALKRLSKTEDTAIHPPGTDFPLLHHTALLNCTNKRDHYLEAMVKSYLIDHPRLFIGAGDLFAQKFWHHAPSVLTLFDQLQTLAALKRQKDRAKSNAEKATLNASLKTAIDRIKTNFLPVKDLGS